MVISFFWPIILYIIVFFLVLLVLEMCDGEVGIWYLTHGGQRASVGRVHWVHTICHCYCEEVFIFNLDNNLSRLAHPPLINQCLSKGKKTYPRCWSYCGKIVNWSLESKASYWYTEILTSFTFIFCRYLHYIVPFPIPLYYYLKFKS